MSIDTEKRRRKRVSECNRLQESRMVGGAIGKRLMHSCQIVKPIHLYSFSISRFGVVSE